jgi:putative transposase
LSKTYQIVTRAAKESAAVIEQFCKANGQILLPIVDMIQSASQVVDGVVHEIGVKTLELILALSAEQVAGPHTPGKASGEIRHYGSQRGRIQLADRKVGVKRPRLRHKTEGEVAIPAYEALRKNQAVSQYMLGALMRGISTREYQEVLPKMAETVGVSRSAVSRQAMEASVEQLKQLQERRWDQVEILVIYIDGQRFAEHHILSAVGVDLEGHKHVLGIASGATENAAAVKQLLTGLRDRGFRAVISFHFTESSIGTARQIWATMRRASSLVSPIPCSASATLKTLGRVSHRPIAMSFEFGQCQKRSRRFASL